MGLLLLFGAASLVVATVLYLKRKRFVDIVERLPGPPGHILLGSTIELWRKFDFDLNDAILSWNAKFGSFYRAWLGPQCYVVITDPEDLEILLTSNSNISKSENYGMLHDWIGQGLLTSTGQKWKSRRKMITPTFHFNILDQFVEVFNKNGDVLIERLMEKSDGQLIDIQNFIHLYTLDVICETAMGTSINAQRQEDSKYVEAVYSACFSMQNRTVRPWLFPAALYKLSSWGKLFYSSVETLHKYTKQVILSRKDERSSVSNDSKSESQDDGTGIKKRSAFLDHLLNARAKGTVLSDGDIQEEVDTFMFEGHDTTSAAISFALYNIAANPHVQEEIQKEMQSIFEDSDRPATSKDLQNMNYLERVLKESLRVHPSVPLFARHLTEDMEFTGGRLVPAGCNVTVACYEMGRNPEIWPNPEKFDPDRFLPENTSRRHPFAYVPFSAGPRNCIGQKFAMLELKAAVSKVLRSFHLSLPAPDYRPQAKGLVVLRAPDGVMLRINKRVK